MAGPDLSQIERLMRILEARDHGTCGLTVTRIHPLLDHSMASASSISTVATVHQLRELGRQQIQLMVDMVTDVKGPTRRYKGTYNYGTGTGELSLYRRARDFQELETWNAFKDVLPLELQPPLVTQATGEKGASHGRRK